VIFGRRVMRNDRYASLSKLMAFFQVFGLTQKSSPVVARDGARASFWIE